MFSLAGFQPQYHLNWLFLIFIVLLVLKELHTMSFHHIHSQSQLYTDTPPFSTSKFMPSVSLFIPFKTSLSYSNILWHVDLRWVIGDFTRGYTLKENGLLFYGQLTIAKCSVAKDRASCLSPFWCWDVVWLCACYHSDCEFFCAAPHVSRRYFLVVNHHNQHLDSPCSLFHIDLHALEEGVCYICSTYGWAFCSLTVQSAWWPIVSFSVNHRLLQRKLLRWELRDALILTDKVIRSRSSTVSI